VSQDQTAASAASRPHYTETEVHALELAAQLRDRVRRERSVVRRLQEHLAGRAVPTRHLSQ
jgi:hypothetical protein